MRRGLFCVVTGLEAKDGVCPEHGETACVVGARLQVVGRPPWWRRLLGGREQ